MRTVRIYIDAVEATTMCTIPGTDGVRKALHAAIGYLSMWNLTFPHVDIYTRSTNPPELLAIYRNEPDVLPAGYVIGAVYQADTNEFTFHS